MHNKINILSSLKVGLLSLMFVLSSNALAADSQYLEEITLPECDASNPEVQFISSNADWSKINDSNKRIFCVKPGNYRSIETVYLTADGTSDKRRYIILDNGNDTHPGKLPTEQQANVQIKFNGASYWTVDRISVDGDSDENVMSFLGNSTHNILNRLFINNYSGGIRIGDGSHYNTIQKSRIQDMSLSGRKADRVAIIITGDPEWRSDAHVTGTKILDNEIVNANDAFMTLRLGEVDVDCPGTIIDNNHMYINSSLYTDGNGHPDPNGSYAYAENAIDLKGGTYDPNNPMIITNNYMWGYRKADHTDSNTDSLGQAVAMHRVVKNVILQNNVIFDNDRGFNIAELFDSKISNNIITNTRYFSIVLYNSSNVNVTNNIWKGNSASVWASVNSVSNTTFSSNAVLDLGNSEISAGTFSNNAYYSTPVYSGDSGSIGSSNVSDAQMTDLVFTTDNYTNNPRTITLSGVVPTASSPHYETVDFQAPNTESTQASEPVPVVDSPSGPFIMDVDTKELR